MNHATFMCFKRMRGINAHVSGPMLKEAEIYFSKTIGAVYSFIWMVNQIDVQTVNNFKERIANFDGNYAIKGITNAD